jgi:hypothetical protein
MTAPETREDRQRLVASLGIPADAAGPGRYIEVGGPVSAAGLAALVDADVAERTWLRWFPDQSARLSSAPFRMAFERLLASAAAICYSLDRFRSACKRLPEPDLDGRLWIEPFERAVAARNALDLRVFVAREVRDEFTTTSLAPESDPLRWDKLTSMMSDGVFYELGVVLPRLDLLPDDSLAPTDIRIEINDARLPRRRLLAADRVLVNDTVERLTRLNVKGEEAFNPANGNECAVIDAADAAVCKQAGLQTWSRPEHAILSISAAARQMAGAFVNRNLVEFFTKLLAQDYPTVVAEVRKAMTHEAITQVLRALVDEEISIRNLRRVLEVLSLPDDEIDADLARYIFFAPAALNRTVCFRDPGAEATIAEQRLFRVRAAMKRYISHKYTRGQNTLIVYLLDRALEERLARPAPILGADRELLLRALRDEIGSPLPTAQTPVILTTASVRLRLRREIGADWPHIGVLSYQELSPDMNIQPIARIEVPELTDPFARLGRPEEGRAVAPATASGDALVERILAARDAVIRATNRRLGSHATSFLQESLDAILGELRGGATAGTFAAALPGRADVPVSWPRVAEAVLDVGEAAAIEAELPADAVRVQDAAHRVASAVTDTALAPAHREVMS